jgi:hypothetical protein
MIKTYLKQFTKIGQVERQQGCGPRRGGEQNRAVFGGLKDHRAIKGPHVSCHHKLGSQWRPIGYRLRWQLPQILCHLAKDVRTCQKHPSILWREIENGTRRSGWPAASCKDDRAIQK